MVAPINSQQQWFLYKTCMKPRYPDFQHRLGMAREELLGEGCSSLRMGVDPHTPNWGALTDLVSLKKKKKDVKLGEEHIWEVWEELGA